MSDLKPNPFAESNLPEQNPFRRTDAPSSNPFATTESAKSEPHTTFGGVASAGMRAVAAPAAGAALGAVAAAPSGIGVPAGAVAGAATASLADFVLGAWNMVAGATGAPHAGTPSEAAGKMLDQLGFKEEKDMSPTERVIESTLRGLVDTSSTALGAAQAAGRYASPFVKGVLERFSDRPVAQAIGAGAAGAAGQMAIESGVDPATSSLIGLGTGVMVPGAGELFGTRPARVVSNTLGLNLPQMPRERMLEARPQNAARTMLSQAYQEGAAGGAPSSRNMMEKMLDARNAGQPMSLLDMENREIQGLAKQVISGGGAPAESMSRFLKGRQEGTRDRLTDMVHKKFSDEGSNETIDRLRKQRQVEGERLWTLARSGTALPKVDAQALSVFRKADHGISQIDEQLLALKAEFIEAAKRETGTDVAAAYLRGEGRTTLDIGKQIEGLEEQRHELRDAQRRAERVLKEHSVNPKMSGPGAVWTPALERILEDPDFKSAWQEAIGIARRDSYKPGTGNKGYFSTTDMAIDEEGNVRHVPDMKTWMRAKTALDMVVDARFNDDMQNRVDRGLSAKTISYMNIRDGLVEELDSMNPHYKPARHQHMDKMEEIRAVRQGENAMKYRQTKSEEFQAYFDKLTPAQREPYEKGVANELNRMIENAGGTVNAETVIPDQVRRRLAIIVGNEERANEIVRFVTNEAQMTKSMKRIDNSPLRMRQEGGAAKRLLNFGAEAVWALIHSAAAAHGNMREAGAAGARGLRAGRYLVPHSEDPRVLQYLGQYLQDPGTIGLMHQGSALSGGPTLLPQLPTPSPLRSATIPGAGIGATGIIPPQQQ